MRVCCHITPKEDHDMNDDQIYLPDTAYCRLVRQLEKLIASGPELHGTDAQTEIATALGETGNIWPQSVLCGAEFGSV